MVPDEKSQKDKTSAKDVLLNTRMDLLGLGGAFNHYFLRFPHNNPRYTPKEPAITLAEFFKLNQKFLTGAMQRFVCNADGDGFTLQSASFQKFKRFLVLNGFTHEDWIMLDVRNRQGALFPFLSTEKQNVLSKRFITLNLVKPKSAVFDMLMKGFTEKVPEDITIADILNFSQEVIDGITGIRGDWKYDYAQIQAFRAFIKKLQEKLSKIGLTTEDGALMRVSFKVVKSFDELSPYMRKKFAEQQASAA